MQVERGSPAADHLTGRERESEREALVLLGRPRFLTHLEEKKILLNEHHGGAEDVTQAQPQNTDFCVICTCSATWAIDPVPTKMFQTVLSISGIVSAVFCSAIFPSCLKHIIVMPLFLKKKDGENLGSSNLDILIFYLACITHLDFNVQHCHAARWDKKFASHQTRYWR